MPPNPPLYFEREICVVHSKIPYIQIRISKNGAKSFHSFKLHAKRWLRFAPRSSWCFLWKVEGLMKFRLRGNWARAEDRPHKSRSSGYHKWMIARGFWPTGICCLLNYFSSNNSILFSSIPEKNLLLKWTNLAAACSNKKLDLPVWKIERWTFFGTKSA